ncbi:MAG: lipopolysaccharide biosynthesis protein, partial [Fidelibacterota bacterium]
MSSQYRNTFGQQYLIIAVNGVAVLSGVFLLNGIIARLFGIEVLGEFLLIKRTVTTVVSILLIGLNIGIPYFLNRESEESVYRNSVLIFILFTLPAIAMFVVLIRAGFTEGFQINHVLGYGLYTIGICMQFFVYAHYRGRHKFFWASLLQLSATAIVPVIIVNFTDDIQQVLAVIGLVNSLLSGILLILLYRGLPYGNYQLERIKIYMKYGLVRFPSFISQFILLAGPGILASSWATYKDVALVNGNMSLIRLLLFILGPIGIIMLPRVSGIKHQQQKDKLGYSLAGLLQITTGIAMIIAAFLYIFNGKILTLWYSLDRTEILPEAKIIILALPFYVIAEILRSPIDGLSYKGINSKVYGLAAIGF